MKSQSIGRWSRHLALLLLLAPSLLKAQTEQDALMMFKNNICFGPTVSYSSWTEYWEGENKRNNANLGRVSTTAYTFMANYGISSTLNIMAGLPYISTKASAGQLHPMKGVQDLSLWIKWQAVQKEVGSGTFSLFALGGYSLPASQYSPDFLPLSIGSGSRSLSLKVIGDYQINNWFATGSATYVRRENIEIDREAYYTTEMHYTNEVKMPDAAQFNVRAGLRNGRWIAEAVAHNWTTLGGFDITKNNMPFPSNRMNMTTLGAHFKYETKFLTGLSFVGGADYTIAGRNVGQSSSFRGGIFYALPLKTASPKHEHITN